MPMTHKIVELTDQQLEDIEERLEAYDDTHFPVPTDGQIRLGIEVNGHLVAGVDAEMTSFRILYVSTLFVDQEYRRQGIATALMHAVEERARELGANLIRLDTFDWQGPEFYRSAGFEEVGQYTADDGSFSEHFFLKRLE